MSSNLFDEKARELRRRRALACGPDLFLHERAFEDILDRLALVQRRFRSALLIGGAPGWSERLSVAADSVHAIAPAGLMQVEPGSYDVCVAVGWLDTANDLPAALLAVRFALQEGFAVRRSAERR